MRANRLLLSLTVGAAIMVAVPVGVALGDNGDPPADVHAAAALGDTISYQGRLTESGAPANGVYDLQFVLYDAETGGAQVTGTDIEARDNVNVTNGVFIVSLDFPAGSFAGDARWLEIAVRPGASTGTYTVLSPRQPVSPVPQALYAKSAGSISLPFSASASTTAVAMSITNGGGVAAKFTGNPVAVEISGGILVSGANQAARLHQVAVGTVPAASPTASATATGGNQCAAGRATVMVDLDADANDIVVVTRVGTSGTGLDAAKSPVGVAFNVTGCTANKWVIYTLDGSSTLDASDRFNVVVFKVAGP